MAASLAVLLSELPSERLAELYGFWDGGGVPPAERDRLLQALEALMGNPRVVEAKGKELGRKLGDVLNRFLDAPGYERSLNELRVERSPLYHSQQELDAAAIALFRRGFLFAVPSERPDRYCIPEPLALAWKNLRFQEAQNLGDLLTLRGFLGSRDHRDAGQGSPISHLRESHKLLAKEEALLARLEHLPADLRALADKVLTGFGGILPRNLFERLSLGPIQWDAASWKKALETHCLGTVLPLRLDRYGIHHDEETLVFFHELTLAYLHSHAFRKKRGIGREVSAGVDLVSNVDRFITFVLENPVKFTVKGEIFRTTERRISGSLFRSTCSEISDRDMLSLIYRFALGQRLIDRTGERTFAISTNGKEWKGFCLEEKLRLLLHFASEEKLSANESMHQLRLRRYLLRWLSNLEPEEWYDAMTLPLLARNSYLLALELPVAGDSATSRSGAHSYAPLEDLQQMAWNLFAWLRKRLHPLGLVDLSYEKSGRPLALRISRMGARVLAPAGGGRQGSRQPHLVVNPDFEVVLFPTEDSYALVHALDRFCDRTKSDRLFHYRLTENSLRRALSEGLSVQGLIDWFQKNCRVPVPQNVVYSIWDWASKTGVLAFRKGNRISSAKPEVLDRFLADPRVKPHLSSRLGPNEAAFKKRVPSRELRRLVLDVGFFLESE